ncbi:MAG: hypothetical protein IPL61_25140 [Myxococcales bacterium]|nr:hypothetical protein [Myxococcales bacterium]
MDRPRARPRFSFHLTHAPDAAIARVDAYLSAHPHPVTGRVFRRTVMLTLAEDRRHFWTPHLEVQFSDAPTDGTDVDGTFAPHPRLWTTFVATQLLFGILALGLAIYVFSLWSLGQGLLVPALLLAGALIGGGLSYGTAYIGQGLGSEQMYELRSFLDAALRDAPDEGVP